MGLLEIMCKNQYFSQNQRFLSILTDIGFFVQNGKKGVQKVVKKWSKSGQKVGHFWTLLLPVVLYLMVILVQY
jgi:hypothetical protein